MFNNLTSAINAWPFIIFFVYIAMLIVVAVLCSKKSKGLNDFMFANKGVGGWLSAFAYGATYFSAVIFVGYAGKFGWNFGLGAIWIGIGNTIFGTFLAWKVLARRTKLMTTTLQARTMPEFFEKRYQSKHIKLVASLLIFIFLLPYSSSVYQGLGYIFSSVLGLQPIYCIVILAGVTAFYLFLGGYMATSITDFIQGTIMIVGITVCVLTLLNNDAVNWGEGISKLMDNNLGFFPAASVAGKSFLDSPLFNLIILILLTSFGIWGLPQSIHKFYAIKDDASIKKGTVISTVFALIVGGGAYFMGSLVTLFVSKGTFAGDLGGNYDKLVPEMITNNLNPALLGLIIVLLFSASMSTLASLSLSSASTVSIDFYKGYIRKRASDTNTTILMRVLCLVFVGISALLAIAQIDAIVTLMSLSWGVLAGCFIGPYVLGLYSKKINKIGAYASMATTLIVTATLIFVLGIITTPSGVGFVKILKAGIGRSPLIGVVCMAMSFIVTPLFSKIFAKKYPVKQELLNTIFAK